MQHLFGKGLLLLCCLLVQLQLFPIEMTSVLTFLLATVISSLEIILPIENRKKIIKELASLAYLLFAFIEPMFICFLPILLYDAWEEKRYVTLGFILIHFMIAIQSVSVFPYCSLVLLSALAVYMQKQTEERHQLKQELLSFRDKTKEHEIIIQEKNRTLRENQDNSIYMATLQERNRIAREIHDNVGHMLTRSILQVGAIKTLNQTEVIKQPLEDLHDTLNQAMTGIRSSVHDLHDESVDLRSAIQEIADSVTTFTVRVDYDMSKHIPKAIKYSFISITKEAVNNAIKHSNATHMDILLREHPGFYQLMVHDNGTDIAIAPQNGIGLTNIEDRVNTLQGTLKISTEQGFKIVVSVMKKNR